MKRRAGGGAAGWWPAGRRGSHQAGAEGVFAKSDSNSLLFAAERGGTRLLRPHPGILHEGTLPPLLHPLRVDCVMLREASAGSLRLCWIARRTAAPRAGAAV